MRIAFLLLGLLSGCASVSETAEPLACIGLTSFNIRYGTANDGVNVWPLRRSLVLDVIDEQSPSVLGVQEALRFQLDEIAAGNPQFEEVGVGRDDGEQAGEYSAIFFDRERFKMLDQGTFWLSSRPEEIASATWGNSIPRICTWVHLEDRQTALRLHVFNTHWDHRSQESREQAAALILARVGEIAEGGPVAVMGDFNAGELNPAFRALVEDNKTPLFDSYRHLHADTVEVGTFNGFKGTNDGEKIDAILLSQHWNVESAVIVRTSKEGRMPSDHYPVSASVRLKGACETD
jgi:endonuclease/exonuclease/phosphatase family metal-dependent hydrolase